MIYSFNAIFIKIPNGFLKIDKNILKFMWKYEGPIIIKTLTRKNDVIRLTLPTRYQNITSYYAKCGISLYGGLPYGPGGTCSGERTAFQWCWNNCVVLWEKNLVLKIVCFLKTEMLKE